MKFSLHAASHLAATYNTGVDPKSYDDDEVIERMGLQLGAVESVERFADKYNGLVVAKVISCEKHPNADKLRLCLIDDGGVVTNVERDERGFVQVVCGAPNVGDGQLIVWIPPGATVPSSYSSAPFVLESRDLRGKMSNGMIASPKELDLSDDHNGILVLSAENVGREPIIGEQFSGLLGMDDIVIDCENKMFTHRPDCFGTLGIARELSGIFGDRFSSPDWFKNPIEHTVTDRLPLHVENTVQELVPRFMVQVISGVTVQQSPLWLQAFLKRIGQKSINNIVDYTNFFMMQTGQPLHAFDYDKVKKLSGEVPTIQPRLAVKGEKISLLNGKSIELEESDIVIATDTQPIAIGGVMGGAETEVDDTTKNIIIEVANFDMYAIRRTSMRHGLFTDAVTRFNKGQSPLQNDRVLAKMVDEVVRFADGKVASEAYDIRGFELGDGALSNITTTAEFINARLGSDLTPQDIKVILENVEFLVNTESDRLQITVPFWRMDISIPEDVVEEVGRLYGYSKLPVNLPPRGSKPATENHLRKTKQALRDRMSRLGANEVLTYSFVHGDTLRHIGTDPDKWAYHVRNAISPDLQYYRTSLIPSLLTKVHPNLKAQAGSDSNEFMIFEIGKAHVKGHMDDVESELPKEFQRLAAVFAADQKTQKNHAGSAYYVAKKYLDDITASKATYLPLDTNEYPVSSPFQIGRSAVVSIDGQVLGVIGEFHASARKANKLPEYCAGFEVDIELLSQHIKPKSYKPLSTFPSLVQDITLEVSDSTPWGDVTQLMHAELAVASAEYDYDFALDPLSIFRANNSDKKRISYRIELTHHAKTLRTEEVSRLLDSLAEAAHAKLDAVRI